MKRIFTLLAISIGTFYSGAQITLDENNTPHSSTYTSVEKWIFSGITVPNEGANQIYDYSNLPSPHPLDIYTYDYFPATRTGFTSFTRYDVGSSLAGSLTFDGEYYTVKNSNGIYDTGKHTFGTTLNLATVTGDANDSIVFLESNSIHAVPAPILTFPNTFGSTANSNHIYTTPFELTVNAYNLQQTPGLSEVHNSVSVETVGYGKLTVPMTGGKSVPYDVLMVKSQKITIDSVFLGGSPAPAALMSAFGMTQGGTSNINYYIFYGEDLERPILTVIMNSNWTAAESLFYESDDLQLDTGVGLTDNNMSEKLNVYPNPASDKLTISIDQIGNSNNQVMIYDVLGKQLKKIEFVSTINDANKIEIDVRELSNGTYFVKISSANETATKKIIINK